MKDRQFKDAPHIYRDYTMLKDGQELTAGYKPDYVLISGDNYVILESERNTSRKAFVGGMIKAAKFLQKTKTGFLVYVIQEKDNTKASQIAAHLKDYLHWIKPLTNMRKVYVISVDEYYQHGNCLEIESQAFLKLAYLIN